MSRSNGRGDLPDGYRFEEVERRVDHLVRIGKVAEVDYERAPQARIKVFLDGDLEENISAWLPLATSRNGPNGEWDPPEVDEQVIVVAPSGTTNNAYVLGTIPQNLFPVHDYAERSPDRHLRWYLDETTFLYDRAQHLWEINNPNADGRHHLLITDNSEIEQTNERIFLRIAETSIEIVDGRITLAVGGTTATLTPDLLEVMAGLTRLSGDLEVGGNASIGGAVDVGSTVTAVGDVTGAGISLETHVHIGVETGPGTSGTPI